MLLHVKVLQLYLKWRSWDYSGMLLIQLTLLVPINTSGMLLIQLTLLVPYSSNFLLSTALSTMALQYQDFLTFPKNNSIYF